VGTKYSSNSTSGYNATPPPDDASTGADNQLTWAKHRDKLGDPIKNLADTINSDLVAHFDQGPVTKNSAFTTTAAEYNTVIEVSGTTTISLGTATTMGKGYFVGVYNADSSLVTTVDLNIGTDTLDGSVGGSITLAAGEARTFIVNNSSNGYLSITDKIVLIDEDTMVSDSSSQAPTQQSVKAYVDSVFATSGTFTPNLEGLTTAGSMTQNVSGRYIKTGKLVTVWVKILVTATATAPVGDMVIKNLPFTAFGGSSDVTGCGSVGIFRGISFSTDLASYVSGGETQIRLERLNSGGLTNVAVTAGNIVLANNIAIYLTLSYESA